MGARWTKRPQNICRSCGYSWYPRGKSVSANCPRCGSVEVELAIEALLRAIGYLLAAPFVLLAYIARLLFRAARAAAKLLRAAISSARQRAEPATTATIHSIARLLKTCSTGAIVPFRWLYSVKDDLLCLAQGEQERVNPVAVFAKLLVVAVGSALGIIAIINLVS
jgi:predicted RNA-binding Zn-ribbon protein involved in translation (DUF1610 family)